MGDDKNLAAYAYGDHVALNDSFNCLVQPTCSFIKTEEARIGLESHGKGCVLVIESICGHSGTSLTNGRHGYLMVWSQNSTPNGAWIHSLLTSLLPQLRWGHAQLGEIFNRVAAEQLRARPLLRY